jgi:hypothetical protein
MDHENPLLEVYSSWCSLGRESAWRLPNRPTNVSHGSPDFNQPRKGSRYERWVMKKEVKLLPSSPVCFSVVREPSTYTKVL